MSTPSKPRGTTGAVPELTKLKLLWRDELAEESKDYWRSLFVSSTTQAKIREQIKAQLEIKLTRDEQLTEFRKWLDGQDAMEREAERQIEEETRLKELHPDWDAERLRSEVIASAMRRAIATGDFNALGMRAVRASQTEEAAKFQAELEKAKLEIARAAETRQQEQLKLMREKFEIECCEKFLSWFKDDRARQIAESSSSNADKIAELRREYFKDVDALQASGQVKLPK